MTAHAGSASFLTMLSPSDRNDSGRNDLRRELRTARRRLSPTYRSEMCERFATIASRVRLFRPRTRIAFYLPYGGEADPTGLMDRARALHCSVYLPVIANYRDSRMSFVPFDPSDRLVRNRYGIPEPIERCKERIAPRCLDMIVMPLVAVDASGWRLGSGAGFYDRCLRHLRNPRPWRRPKLIGLAYDFQRVPKLVPQPWDVPVDAVLTEKDLYLAQRSYPCSTG